MVRYLARRVGFGAATLLLITMLNFLFIKLAPGDPVLMLIPEEMLTSGGQISPEWLDQQRRRLGLDKPIPVQYAIWLREVLSGNLGRSLASKRPVGPMVRERIGPTLKLTSSALLVSLVIGVSVGVLSAIKRRTMIDYIATFFSFLAVSIPNYFLGLLMVYVFALRLKWFPTSGMTRLGEEATFWGSIRYLTLPCLVVGLSGAASLVRYTRSSMLEVMRQDYVRTARAKGLPERQVRWHAFRNGLLPVITVISLSLPQLVSGSIIVERIFNWPGMGTLAIAAVFQRDYPIIMAVNLIVAVLVLLANMAGDVAYAIADPRIHYD